jgi:hypothetical protein
VSGLLRCWVVVLPNNYWYFKEGHNSETSLFTSQHVTFQKIWIFISAATRFENLTCRGLFFYFPWTLQASAAIVPLNDYDFLLPKVLSNDRTRLPLAQVQIFGFTHIHCMGLQLLYSKRPHLLTVCWLTVRTWKNNSKWYCI